MSKMTEEEKAEVQAAAQREALKLLQEDLRNMPAWMKEAIREARQAKGPTMPEDSGVGYVVDGNTMRRADALPDGFGTWLPEKRLAWENERTMKKLVPREEPLHDADIITAGYNLAAFSALRPEVRMMVREQILAKKKAKNGN